MSGPVQVVVTALIHCQQLEGPPAPLAAAEHKQAPTPVIRVTEGLQQPPLSMEPPALAPAPQLLLATAPKDGFPSPVIPVFVVFVLFMHLFNGLNHFVL